MIVVVIIMDMMLMTVILFSVSCGVLDAQMKIASGEIPQLHSSKPDFAYTGSQSLSASQVH